MASAQLEVAIQAARRAGNYINRESLSLDSIEVHEKAPFDFVSRVDTESQNIIKGLIAQYFPRDMIIAEEDHAKYVADAPAAWIIDPLDGTTNFLHGFPQYAVSIAYAVKGRVMVAVVYDPTKNELTTRAFCRSSSAWHALPQACAAQDLRRLIWPTSPAGGLTATGNPA